MQSINDISAITNANNTKDLANKIRRLYTGSIITFVNQVAQNANKQVNMRYDSIKKIPECVRNTSLF